MGNKDTSESAFPRPAVNSMYPGMTLRDYFAAQVLVGLSIRREGKSDEADAKCAYALADAMLKARQS